MTILNPIISLIILNINGLNTPIKRDYYIGVKKQDPNTFFLEKTLKM